MEPLRFTLESLNGRCYTHSSDEHKIEYHLSVRNGVLYESFSSSEGKAERMMTNINLLHRQHDRGFLKWNTPIDEPKPFTKRKTISKQLILQAIAKAYDRGFKQGWANAEDGLLNKDNVAEQEFNKILEQL